MPAIEPVAPAGIDSGKREGSPRRCRRHLHTSARSATAKRRHKSELGSIHALTKESFPILERISIRRLVLEPGAIREPHWHADADELTYCVSGDVLVSVLDNADVFGSFTIGAGEMFHVEAARLHHIENVGDTAAELIVAFSSADPRTSPCTARSAR